MDSYIPVLLAIVVIVVGVYLSRKGAKPARNPQSPEAQITYREPDAIPEKPAGETAYVFIDVETTGLNPSNDAIVQLSAVRYFGEKAADGINTYINPGKPIPASATRIHGITNAMVRGAPAIQDVREPFMDLIRDAVLVGYNVIFDLNFLNKAFDDALADVRYIDVLRGARDQLDLPDYKLETVASHLGVTPMGKFHNALNDCYATASIFFYLGLQSDENSQRTYYSRISSRSNRGASLDSQGQDSPYWYGSQSYQYWATGERERIDGNIDQALQLFDQAKTTACDYEGAVLVIYESYAKAYRKLRDFEKEISVLDEAIRFCEGTNWSAEKFEVRKKRAIEIQTTHQRREEEERQRAIRREQRAERRRQEEELAKSKPKKAAGRAVIQYADDGTEIQQFETVTAAAEAMGIHPKGIRDAANGKQKRAAGFAWRYAETLEAEE